MNQIKRKIIVTGAAGFIGAALSKKLILFGDKVVGIDNLNNYYDIKLKEGRLREIEEADHFNKWKFFKYDLDDFKQLEMLFNDFN